MSFDPFFIIKLAQKIKFFINFALLYALIKALHLLDCSNACEDFIEIKNLIAFFVWSTWGTHALLCGLQ